MKKLLILLALFISVNCYNQTDYIKYINGYFPILITAGHGGTIRDDSIDNRNCSIVQCNSDLNTDKLAVELYTEFMDNDVWPYLLVNDLHRQELDVNRSREEAYADDKVAGIYSRYHNNIEEFIRTNIHSTDYMLILDIHGQSHSHGFIELGYNITHNELELPDLNMNTTSSLHSINDYTLNSLVRGEASLGRYLSDDYKVTPSPKYPVPPLPYFNGGYTTEKYKEYKNVIVIQLELPYEIRKNKTNRMKFVKLLREAVINFYEKIN